MEQNILCDEKHKRVNEILGDHEEILADII